MKSFRWLQSLLTLRYSYRSVDRGQAQVTLLFSVFFIVLNAVVLIALPVWAQDARAEISLVLFTVPGLAITLPAYRFTQVGRLRLASSLLTVYLMALGMGAVVANGMEGPFMLTLAIPLVYVGLSFGARGIITLDVLFSLQIIVIGYGQGHGLLPFLLTPDPAGLTFVGIFEVAILLIISFLLGLLSRENQRALAYGDRLVTQLRATAQLAQATSTILDLEELLRRTVDYIRDQFAFYHVQIFLVDKERRYATLAASTGEVGAALLERSHRLAIGSQSIIGRATLSGMPVIAQDTMDDPLHRINDLLPATRSELAVPLIAGDQVIGSLDVQSTRPNAFLQDDVDSLQIVASQVSIALRNAQLFAEQKLALDENQRLLGQAETNLREIERLNQRLSDTAWGDYLRTRQAPLLGVTFRDKRIGSDLSWTPGLTQAMQTQRPVVVVEGNRQIASVPIGLNGRVIGAIEVEVPGGIQQAELTDLIQAVAGRLALTLENARLFEQAQTLAQQELTVNAISARMQTAIDVDELLRMTLSELGRTLGATNGSIRLGTEFPDAVQSEPPTAKAESSGNSENGSRRAR